MYEPVRVYLLRREGDGVSLGELVEHRYADETAGVQQACVYVALVNSAGQIYIQHRAKDKRMNPDRKTISASGHVDPGDTFEQAAVREVEEELGVTLDVRDLRLVGSFTGLSHCGPVYEVRSDQVPRPSAKELDVKRSAFLAVSQLERLLIDPDPFTPSGTRALGVWLAAHRDSAYEGTGPTRK